MREDTHQDIRRRLFEAAWDTPTFAPAPERVVARARRRAATTIGGASLVAILAIVVAASSFPVDMPDRTAGVIEGGDDREYLVDIVSGKATEITEIPAMERAWWPDVSPDGERITFTTDTTGSPQVYVANLDGSGMRQLTQGLRESSEPSWSPDGERIAYVGMRADGRRNVYVVTVATGRSRRITDEHGNVWSPDWSPDGRSILYNITVPGETPDPVDGVFLLNVSSQQLRAVDVETGSSRKVFGGRHAMAYDGTWTRDGIVFLRGRDVSTQGPSVVDLVLLRDGETRPERLVTIPLESDEMAWGANASPDGRTIAFARHLDGLDRIVLVDVSTGRARELRPGSQVSWADPDTLLVQERPAAE